MKSVEVVLNVPMDMSFTYSIPEGLEGETLFGKRVVVPFGLSEKTGFVIEEKDKIENVSYEIKSVKRVIDKEAVFNKDLVDCAFWMRDMYLSPVGINLSSMIPSGRRESEWSVLPSEVTFKRVENLTEEQENALSVLRKEEARLYYIFGITGSGKSEVYLRRAEDIIGEGKQVLYLVPEITLTHQLSDEVYSRFNARVAILHSQLTPSQRLREWLRIKNGEVDIIIGARSSVFAPFKNLGLIILDEEHEGAYKSGSSPRYSARQVAQYRAEKNKSELIMGSASPSLEAWRQIRSGKIKTIVMRHRIGEGRFPSVSIIDMNKEHRNISPILEKEIRATLSEKRQVILFLNRRGFLYGYVCQSCGHVIECPNCSVSLTYHKRENKLICHTCGYKSGIIKACPVCRNRDLVPSGFGTEAAEDEIRQLFPLTKIERVDTDTTKGDKEKTKKILSDFRDGKIDILLGTQMIAKGLNFPLVSLVGIINADSSLALPDFRAGEKTFDMLYQVAGRAGRYRDDGKVIIQTRHPGAHSIVSVALNNVEDFFDRELTERAETGFPPFSRLVNLTLRSKNKDKAEEVSENLYAIICSRLTQDDDIEAFSPSPCLIEKLAQQWRFHVLLRAKSIAHLLSFTKEILSAFRVPSSVYLEIDVDPVGIL